MIEKVISFSCALWVRNAGDLAAYFQDQSMEILTIREETLLCRYDIRTANNSDLPFLALHASGKE